MDPPNLHHFHVILDGVYPSAVHPRRRRQILLSLLDDDGQRIPLDLLLGPRLRRLDPVRVEDHEVLRPAAARLGRSPAAEGGDGEAQRVVEPLAHHDEPPELGERLLVVEGRAGGCPVLVDDVLSGRLLLGLRLEPDRLEDAADGEEAFWLFDDAESWRDGLVLAFDGTEDEWVIAYDRRGVSRTVLEPVPFARQPRSLAQTGSATESQMTVEKLMRHHPRADSRSEVLGG